MTVIFFDFEKTIQGSKSAEESLQRFKENKIVSGHSYIFNIKELLNSNSTVSQKLLYIELASFRNWTNYYIFKVKTLDLRLLTDEQQYILQNCRLFKVKENEINFIYE